MFRRINFLMPLLIYSFVATLLCIPRSVEGKGGTMPVRFAVIGDRTGGHTPGVYGAIISEIELLKPDFVMTVGDMIEGYGSDYTRTEAEWDEYLALVEPLFCPIHFTPGNHDIWDDRSRDIYRNRISENYHSFDYLGLHFVVLDVSLINRTEDFPQDQLDWLKKDLKKNRKAAQTFVFMHKPLWFQTLTHGKSDRLHEVFREYGVDAVFTGHFHNYFSAEYDGIKYTSIGSSGGGSEPMPHGLLYHFAWVTVDERGISVAVIKKDSVLPWDNFTAQQLVLVDSLQRAGINLDGKIVISEETPLENLMFSLRIHNPAAGFAFADTLRWEVEGGWKVEPVCLPVVLLPGGDQYLEFKLSNQGELYPVPVVALNFAYAEGELFKVEHPLQLTRETRCYMVDSPPSIDGRIDEACWQSPVVNLYDASGTPAKTDPVQFYFSMDEANLYLAATCWDNEIAGLSENTAEHDGAVYNDDCVGYFFQPDTDKDEVFQIYINPRGTVYDVRFFANDQRQWDAARDWNGEFEIKTIKAEDYWSLEARIPFDQLGVKIGDADKWGVNFRRKQPRLKAAADWQLPVSFDPNTLGMMFFE